MLGKQTQRLLIVQTHFSEDAVPEAFRLSPIVENEGVKGRWYREYDEGTTSQEALDELRWTSWVNSRSFWLTKESLLQSIADAGFDMVLEQYDGFDSDIVTAMGSGGVHRKLSRGVVTPGAIGQPDQPEGNRTLLLTFADRLEMIRTLSSGTVVSIVELGVYKGEFAEFCFQTLHPKKHVLIDFWDYEAYAFVLPGAPQNAERESIFHDYFDNDPKRALGEAYLQVKKAFAHRPGAEIVKADIAEAASRFPDGSFEIIYLDGNHTYEFVLRDLHTWFPKLAPGGLFVCNDFFESRWASKQNIAVIPAFQSFSKRLDVHSIALSMSAWSDFYFSNQAESPLITRLRDGLAAAGHNNLEVPNEMLAAYHHRLIERPSGRHLLPSFQL